MSADLPRVVDAAGARRHGISAQRWRTELARGRWRPLARGVALTRPDEPSRADWIVGGLLVAGDTAAVTGWDAVEAYGLPTPPWRSRPILIVCGTGSNRRWGPVRIRPSVRVVSTRSLALADDLPPRPVPTVTCARAVADAALGIERLDVVRALVTGAVQRERCSVSELVAELDTGPRNGSWALRRAVEDLIEGAASVAEAEAADLLRAGDLPPFELNVPIVNAAGRTIAVADVLWRRLRAVLEVDSRRHHFLEADWRATMQRHNLLTGAGLTVTHWAPAELRDRPERAIRSVERWLRARAAELGCSWRDCLDEVPPGREMPLVIPASAA